MVKLGISNRYLCRRLRRSEPIISLGLSGKRKTVLRRIVRHLDYLERIRGKKTEAATEA